MTTPQLLTDQQIEQAAFSVWNRQVKRLPLRAAIQFARAVLALSVTPILAAAQPPAAREPSDEGEREIIATYKALHANKLGAHWLWVVIEQIAAGVPEDEAMEAFGYFEPAKSLCPPNRPAGEVAKDAARLDWLEAQGHPDYGWECRNSTTGRGYRVHQDPRNALDSLREAIDAAMLPTKE